MIAETLIIRAEERGHGLIQAIKELYRYREVLVAWTIRDIKVRYKQSFLGAAWAILQPLSLMIIFTVVFSFIVRVPTGGVPYPIFSYTALLPWTFFMTSITFGTSSLVNNMNLVTKIYTPREIFPLATIGASFFDFLVASGLFLGMLIFYQVPFRITWLLVPIVLLIQILLTGGVVFFAAAANVFYRDLRFVIPLGLQLWLYATPIIYPLSMVPEWLRAAYMLNPMAGIIDSYRVLILGGEWPPWEYLGMAAAVSLFIFISSYLWFKRVEMEFADVI